jgi:acyl-CoA-binding protein
LKLYQQALECISQRRLPATIFQEYFPSFVQRYGAIYADRLGRLGAEFLGNITELNRYDLHRSAGVDGRDKVQPPIFDASNPTRWFEQYAEYAGKLNAQALKAYRRQLDQVAAGESTAEDVQKKTQEQMAEQLPGFLQRVGELYFDLIKDLDELRSDYEENYLGGILALAGGRESEPVNFVTLNGPLGGVAFASFTVTNTTGHRTPIRYIATEIRRMDGVGAAFAPKVAITPEVLELGPGEEATISFSLQLEADRYDAEAPYIGFLYITGDGDLRVEMQLRVVATHASASEV